MKSRSKCKGQSIIELTLLTPVLLAALYVPFDFGMAIYAGHLTQNAVRDGVRVAASTDLLDNAAAAALAGQVRLNLPRLLVGPPSVTVEYFDDGAASCAHVVQVNAQGTYNPTLYRFITLLGVAPPAPMTITRTTKMRYEFQPDANGGTGATVNFCTTKNPGATGTAP